MRRGDRIGIVCCSNCLSKQDIPVIDDLTCKMGYFDLEPVLSDYLFQDKYGRNPSGKVRAEALMQMYADPDITAVWDVSGGDIANEVLCHLDFQFMCSSEAVYWGYSDNTTIANAIYSMNGERSVLYQPKNFTRTEGGMQLECLESFLNNNDDNMLLDFGYEFVQGEEMHGTVIGGNARCFLKLAGTPFFPDIKGHILLLEGWRGGVEQLTTYFSQLKQMGVFEQVNGVLLGTFTQLAEEGKYKAEDILKNFVPDYLPVAVTPDIGHAHSAKAVMIGGYYRL